MTWNLTYDNIKIIEYYYGIPKMRHISNDTNCFIYEANLYYIFTQFTLVNVLYLCE